MRKEYVSAEMEIVKLDVADIVTDSPQSTPAVGFKVKKGISGFFATKGGDMVDPFE